MKNIQNWEKFNESYDQEMINEGLIGDIIKLPFKIVGFLLKPLVPLLLKVIGKTISIENKWKVVKAILDNNKMKDAALTRDGNLKKNSKHMGK